MVAIAPTRRPEGGASGSPSVRMRDRPGEVAMLAGLHRGAEPADLGRFLAQRAQPLGDAGREHTVRITDDADVTTRVEPW